MKRHRGFTLLEVILAIGIFAGAVAVFSEVVRMGLTNSRVAKKQLRAVVLCESKMDEILSGLADVADVSDSSITDSEDPSSQWVYSVSTSYMNDDSTLVALRVTVKEGDAKRKKPVTFTMTQWLSEMTSSSSSSSTTSEDSSSSSSSTSSSSGGK